MSGLSGPRRRAILVSALVILAGHALAYRSWTIDDAGITFAYARNLADGHGLVAQPGALPVEGYSNPLWTLLIATLYAGGVFAISLTPKLIAFGLTAAALTLIYRDLVARPSTTLTLSWPLALLAMCTPFVIWTMSGLENALLACLVVLACANSLSAVDQAATRKHDVRAGLLGALMGLTRPEALLYTGAHAAAVAAAEWTRGSGFAGRSLKRWLTTAVALVPVYGAYLLFRVVYFGDVVPNTYHAKQKPSAAGLLSPGKLVDLVESATGDFVWVVPFFAAIALVALVRYGVFGLRQVVLFAYLGVATATYLVMPPDWMGEFRFATAFFPLLYWTLADLAAASAAANAIPAGVRRLVGLAAVLCAVQAGLIFGARAIVFRTNPPVPLASIRQYGAQGFERLAAIVDAPQPSILTSDLGGMLLDSRLKVIDLAGLCDRTIARSLSITGDPSRLHDYVFEETRPTFMHVVGTFARLSRFHTDPRFERDYVPIFESWEGPPEWPAIWKAADRVPPFIGDYVRRDAVAGDQAVLDQLRLEHRRGAMERSVGPWQVRRDGVGIKRPLTLHAVAYLTDYWGVRPSNLATQTPERATTP